MNEDRLRELAGLSEALSQSDIITGFHDVRRELTSISARVSRLITTAQNAGFKDIGAVGEHVETKLDEIRDFLFRKVK